MIFIFFFIFLFCFSSITMIMYFYYNQKKININKFQIASICLKSILLIMNFPNGIFTHNTYQSWHFTYNIMDKASPQKKSFSDYLFLFLPFSKILSFLCNSSKGTSALILFLTRVIKKRKLSNEFLQIGYDEAPPGPPRRYRCYFYLLYS